MIIPVYIQENTVLKIVYNPSQLCVVKEGHTEYDDMGRLIKRTITLALSLVQAEYLYHLLNSAQYLQIIEGDSINSYIIKEDKMLSLIVRWDHSVIAIQPARDGTPVLGGKKLFLPLDKEEECKLLLKLRMILNNR